MKTLHFGFPLHSISNLLKTFLYHLILIFQISNLLLLLKYFFIILHYIIYYVPSKIISNINFIFHTLIYFLLKSNYHMPKSWPHYFSYIKILLKYYSPVPFLLNICTFLPSRQRLYVPINNKISNYFKSSTKSLKTSYIKSHLYALNICHHYIKCLKHLFSSQTPLIIFHIS
jgi:hypothetical protein